MVYILAILMLLILMAVIYLIISIKHKENDKVEILNILFNNKEHLIKDINEFRMSIKDDNLKYNTQINGVLEKFVSKMSKIDEAQKNIEKLTDETLTLQKILSDKKSRGTFGEQRLEQILEYIYGDDKLYKSQYRFSNGAIVDVAIYLNNKIKLLAIDSKFPLENYILYQETGENEYKKNFISNVKKHVDDIAKKYIIEGETINQAIMFIPSESIFQDIYANYEQLVEYAYSKRVWICSQTTLMIYMTTMQFINLENIKIENSEYILKEMIKFSTEFERYNTRWENLTKDFIKLSKDFDELSITSNKIMREFQKIKNINIKERD